MKMKIHQPAFKQINTFKIKINYFNHQMSPENYITTKGLQQCPQSADFPTKEHHLLEGIQTANHKRILFLLLLHPLSNL